MHHGSSLFNRKPLPVVPEPSDLMKAYLADIRAALSIAQGGVDQARLYLAALEYLLQAESVIDSDDDLETLTQG